MERNRINLAKYCILLYGEKYFEQIRSLIRPDLEEALNLPHHGLNHGELVILLYELFSSYVLVAKRDGHGFFTPSLNEIEAALADSEPFDLERVTFYGMTSGGYDLMTELRTAYGETPPYKGFNRIRN